MSKIKKVNEVVDLSVYTKFTKDLGLFQVNASIWSIISQDCRCSHDISDIQLDFLIDNKRCKYNGFGEIYEKLYGKGKFSEFCDNLNSEFEEAYYKQTTYKTK